MEQQNLSPTPASAWSGAAEFLGNDLELPSGNVARVKRMSPAAFLTGGSIPDPLTAIIRRAIHTKKGLNPKDLENIADDPEQLAAVMQMLDQVLCYVVVEPKVKMPPACDVGDGHGGVCGEYANTDVHQTPTRAGHHAYSEGLRDPNVLYADVVVMEDKMFIFQWALSGTMNLESFREELKAGVDALQNGEDVRDDAQQPA